MTTGRITVRWANPTHAFLAAAEVTLSLAGRPVAPISAAGKSKSKPGFLQFDVDPIIGTSLSLRVVVPAPPSFTDPIMKVASGEDKRPLLDFQQDFHIENVSTPVPEKPSTGWHPRIRPTTAAGAAKSAVVTLEIDLSFIDVTSHFLNTRRAHFEHVFFRSLDEHTVLDGEARSFLKKDFADCQLRLLQFTGGAPGVFGVLVPPAISKGDRSIGAVLYQKPTEGTSYSTIQDASLFSLARFVTSYGDGTKWDYDDYTYFSATVEDDAWFGYFRPFDPRRAAAPAQSADAESADAQSPAPPSGPCTISELPNDNVDRGYCGFPRVRLAKQLADSGKKAIVVIPLVSGNAGPSAGSEVRSMLASIVASLQGDDLVGDTSRATVSIGKLALAGFSAGGQVTFNTLRANDKVVDEVWLFDPMGLKPNWGVVQQWLTPERRARWIGGDKLAYMHEHRTEIGDSAPTKETFTVPESPGNATVWPREKTFFRRSHLYAHTRAFVDTATGPWTPGLRIFDTIQEAEVIGKNPTIAAPAVRKATQSTGVREVIREPKKGVHDNCVYLVAILPNQAPSSIEEFPDTSVCELAEHFLGQLAQPIQTSKQFSQMSADFRSANWMSLHQWPVIGGQSIGDEESIDDWHGYFELCLKFSTFS